MILFNYPIGNPSSDVMRDIALEADVDWDATAIQYQNGGIGYADAPDDADPVPIQDASESVIGIRPSVIE